MELENVPELATLEGLHDLRLDVDVPCPIDPSAALRSALSFLTVLQLLVFLSAQHAEVRLMSAGSL